MRINHNIAALNTYNQLSKNNETTNSALKKLSSGLRINNAGDDPAGMAISEKMRAQIRGLNQATRNAQDGISLIQTAEGALNETTSILQRMRELSVQAGNETATDEDRATIQKEIDQLAEEVTRIADTTKFNGQALMSAGENGVFSGVLQIGADSGQVLNVELEKMDAITLGVGVETTTQAYKYDTGNPDIADEINGATVTFTGDFSTEKATDELIINVKITTKGADGTGAGAKAEISIGGADAVEYTADAEGKFTVALGDGKSAVIGGLGEEAADTEGTITLSAVADGDPVTVLEGYDIETSEKAGEFLKVLDTAIDTVSEVRSKLGSYTNRLEYTITNLQTAAENMSAAESRIRDVDMASEIMEFTKMNVLSQAAQVMLAQANAQPQSILQLLNS